MNRRDFLKDALTIAALTPLACLDGQVLDGAQPANPGTAHVTRRPYKNEGFTLPLLGFGMMRLPEKDGAIDEAAAQAMVDQAMAAGVNYFDTAYMYHKGESEAFVGRALKKYKRNSYFLTSKMPLAMLKTEADVSRIFDEQLQRTQAGCFDFYFMHWVNPEHWKKAQECHVLDFMKKKQAESKIRYIGFSYHGEPEFLKTVASSFKWDLVQIQLNYLDWELCRSGEQYKVLEELGIPVAIMEPLKGGALVKLTQSAQDVFKKANPTASMASWGLRYAASLPNVQVVLSGMSALEHVTDNIRTFTPFCQLTEDERNTISNALAAYRKAAAVPCTACRYCSPCPADVDIPRNIALHNMLKAGAHVMQCKLVYDAMEEDLRASSCVACGACKRKCPQQIDIPELMKVIAEEFK